MGGSNKRGVAREMKEGEQECKWMASILETATPIFDNKLCKFAPVNCTWPESLGARQCLHINKILKSTTKQALL